MNSPRANMTLSSKVFHFSWLLVTILFVSSGNPAVVTWKPNKSFSLASNFKDGIVPCSKTTVVFPESVQESVLLAGSSVSANELILPINGEILLAEDEPITIGADPKEVNCTNDGYAFYKDDSSSSWQNPDVWSSPRFNKATPDAERLPCFDDDVVFPTTKQFTLLLPDSTQYVSEIEVGGRSLTSEEFQSRISSQRDEYQQFVSSDEFLSYPVKVTKQPCKSTVGCPCQLNGLRINCNLKYCPAPKCSNPIKPIGHCCEICGGSLLFEADNLNMRAFKNLVKSNIESYGANKFEYHVGILPIVDPITLKMMPKRVQVIIMDKNEYTGASSEVANEIGYQMSKEWAKNDKLVLLSGSPVSEIGLGSKIAGSMFFVVILMFSVLFGFYYRTSNINLTELRNGFSGRNLLSRIQRRSDSVVSLTRRDSAISALRGSSGGTAFRNPLYNSKKGRVVVAESAMED